MKVFYSGYGKWHVSNSESLPKEAEEAEVSNLHPDSEEAIRKHWAQLQVPFCIVTGVFNLKLKNQKEMKYKNETDVQCLLPCYDHKDGVNLDGYAETDDVTFSIGTIKITREDILPEDTEMKKGLSLTAERTYLNIIAALLEYIKGDIKDIKKHPSYGSDGLLITSIEGAYIGNREFANIGLSKRTLEDKFARAKKSLSESVIPPKKS